MSQIVAKIGPMVSRAIVQARPKLSTALYYARAETLPPNPTELPQIARGFSNLIRAARTGTYKQLTVREAWLNTLITVEVLGWFFVGEIIGRRSLVGYDV